MIRLRMLLKNEPASDTATTTGGGVTTVDIMRLLRKTRVKGYVATFKKRASKAISESATARRASTVESR
jgi:hypothetical protein